MFDAKSLLDQFLGSASGQPGARGDGLGSGQGNGLGNILGQLNGFGGGAAAGGLVGLLLGTKQGRRLAGNALQYGGMAVVGALAYRAFQNWQAGRTSAAPQLHSALLPPPADTPFAPAAAADQQSLARHLLRAMVAAAKADGHIDDKERAAIFSEMQKLPLSTADRTFVMDELNKPLDIDAVARGARTPEEAASLYMASLLAIDVDHAAERGYLAMLAARLHLDDALVAHLHATIETASQPQPPAAA